MKRIASIAVVTAISMWAGSSLAKEPAEAQEREFGDQGVVGIGVETRLDASYSSVKPPTGDSGSQNQFGIGVNLAYFVVDGVSVGGIVGFDRFSAKAPGATESDTDTSFSLMAMGGYHLWLQPGTLSLWPQIGIGWNHLGISGGGGDITSSQVQLGLFVPVLIHPVKHFHFGVGPFAKIDLTSSVTTKSSAGVEISGDGNKATTIGLMGEIAGWL